MQFQFLVEGTDTKVTLEACDGGWKARVGEFTWQVGDWSPGHFVLDGQRSVRYGYSWEGPKRRGTVTLSGRPVQLELAQGKSGVARAGQSGAVKAPMNGQVTKVAKKVGDPVTAGEVVLVLEAMKMENEVTAPLDGVITSISVEPGQAVAGGDDIFVVAKP